MTIPTSAPASSSRPKLFCSHAISTLPQIDRTNAGREISVELRPIAGVIPSLTIEGGKTSSLSLWHTTSRSGFLTIPKFAMDVVTIRFVVDGAIVRRDRHGDHVGRPTRAMMALCHDMRSEEASAGFASIGGTVTRTALASALLALGGQAVDVPLPRFCPSVDATSRPLQTLMRTMETVFQQLKAGVQEADLVFPLLEEIMVYRLLTAWPREGAEPLPYVGGPSQRPLRRAKDYIDGHLGGKLLLADIAHAAGVGVRRLQLMFRSEVGRTPVQYILDRRLDRVRADLRNPSEQATPIGTIAARWGFAHMGEFGRRYRARFGEPPSLTRLGRKTLPTDEPR